MSVMIFLGLCVILAAYDWKHRAVPRFVPVVGIVSAALLISWSPLGAVIGLGLAYVADVPLGDLAVSAMLGAWIGVEALLVTWIIATVGGIMVWTAWADHRIDWPGEWPFTPFLLVPACAIVLVQGV